MLVLLILMAMIVNNGLSSYKPWNLNNFQSKRTILSNDAKSTAPSPSPSILSLFRKKKMIKPITQTDTITKPIDSTELKPSTIEAPLIGGINNNNNNNNHDNNINSNSNILANIEIKKQRRERYPGKYPKKFDHRYKELNQDQATIEQVIRKGKTPAGQHLPIMVNEILNLANFKQFQNQDGNQSKEILICDATLGYGGHFQRIIEKLELFNCSYKMIGIDQDYHELQKTKKRIYEYYHQLVTTITNLTTTTTTSTSSTSSFVPKRNIEQEFQTKFSFFNSNFQEIEKILQMHFPNQQLSFLLADLGFSSMQVDNPTRGFSYKAKGPLDMRMNHTSLEVLTAYDLLANVTISKLIKIFKENSDEQYAVPLAKGIKQQGMAIANTTTDLYQRIAFILTNNCGLKKKEVNKELIDGVAARVMQALRIEVNQEFTVLENLLDSLPRILAPRGKAIFLTFHSGEDRRVKKAMKEGTKVGIYQEYNRNVIRASTIEQNSNPRSKSCKLRYCVKSDS